MPVFPADAVAELGEQVAGGDIDGAGAIFAAELEVFAIEADGELGDRRWRGGIGGVLGAELGDVGVDFGEEI